jgi:hypothetical protein
MKISTTLAGPARRPANSPNFLIRLRNWLMDWDDEDLTREEMRRRMRSRPGLYASMSPETLEFLRTYDGPEVHGPPPGGREWRNAPA